MDIYSKKSRWKIYLGVAGGLIVLISAVYTSYLAQKLAEEENKKINMHVSAINALVKNNELAFAIETTCPDAPQLDFTYYQNVIQSNTTIPMLLVSQTGVVDDAVNYGRELDSLEKAKEYQYFVKNNAEPFYAAGQRLYFRESTLLTQLRYYPIIQLGLIGTFILFGYLAFSSARRAQENRVWVGMAKETAHQLGTPISGIIGWVEHLKLIREEDKEVMEISTELRKDVTRLELVADRFSKIGSDPKLQKLNVYEELDKCRTYMERRSPRKVDFQFPNPEAHTPIFFNINAHLFDWVVENLLRNALDSMGGKGTISAEITADENNIFIDISDTGGGIPANKFKTIFNPGYTTKKRGWGLGLSLAKRIIEKYHTGKIFVKKSVEDVGTTFTIQMPKSK